LKSGLRSRRITFLATAAFAPDGKRMVTASTAYTARVWDAEGERGLATGVSKKLLDVTHWSRYYKVT
jgi:WD40 repeat protein